LFGAVVGVYTLAAGASMPPGTRFLARSAVAYGSVFLVIFAVDAVKQRTRPSVGYCAVSTILACFMSAAGAWLIRVLQGWLPWLPKLFA
jgi:hypothetical protein